MGREGELARRVYKTIIELVDRGKMEEVGLYIYAD